MPSIKQIARKVLGKSKGHSSAPASVCSSAPVSILRQRPVAYVGNDTILTETAFGHKIYLDASDASLTPHIIWHGRWEPWVTDFYIRELRAGMTFFDIGANCGFFSLLGAHLVGPDGAVLAIEPQEKLFKLIQKSTFVNGFNSFTKPYQMAVGQNSNVEELAKSDFLAGSASLVGLGTYTDNVEKVQVEPLTEIVRRASEDFGREILPDMMKIDVEGYEEEAWLGARDVFARCGALTVCLEFSPLRYDELGSSPENFLSMIRQDGFDVFLLDHKSKEHPVEGQIETQILSRGGQSDLILRKCA